MKSRNSAYNSNAKGNQSTRNLKTSANKTQAAHLSTDSDSQFETRMCAQSVYYDQSSITAPEPRHSSNGKESRIPQPTALKRHTGAMTHKHKKSMDAPCIANQFNSVKGSGQSLNQSTLSRTLTKNHSSSGLHKPRSLVQKNLQRVNGNTSSTVNLRGSFDKNARKTRQSYMPTPADTSLDMGSGAITQQNPYMEMEDKTQATIGPQKSRVSSFMSFKGSMTFHNGTISDDITSNDEVGYHADE